MKSKSEKYRELLDEEKYLRDQQYRMLKKAFKNLGLKVGYFGEMIGGQADVTIAEITDWSVNYCRRPGVRIVTCEISFEDLFDAEEE